MNDKPETQTPGMMGSAAAAGSGLPANDQPAGLGAAGAQSQAKPPELGIQQISDSARLDWLDSHAWEQNEANHPYAAFCQIVLTHYGSVIPIREAIDLAMQNTRISQSHEK